MLPNAHVEEVTSRVRSVRSASARASRRSGSVMGTMTAEITAMKTAAVSLLITPS